MNTAKLQALEALTAELTAEEQLALIEHLAVHMRQNLGRAPQAAVNQPGLPGIPSAPPAQAPLPAASPASQNNPIIAPRNRTALDWMDGWLATPDAMGSDWWDAFRREVSDNRPTFGQPPGQPQP